MKVFPFLHKARRRSEEGFSLIELMVVMVIIGLMTSAAVVLLSGSKDPVIEQAEHISATLNALSRESVVSGTVMGVRMEAGALAIRSMTADGWSESNFKTVKASDFLGLAHLNLVGAQVDPESSNQTDPQKGFVPQIWFLPTGEFPPFEITALIGGKSVSVSGVPGSMIRASVNE
jgi:general secretion pathway protein H